MNPHLHLAAAAAASHKTAPLPGKVIPEESSLEKSHAGAGTSISVRACDTEPH